MYALSAVSANGRICKSNITLMEWKHYIVAPNLAKICSIEKRPGQDKTVRLPLHNTISNIINLVFLEIKKNIAFRSLKLACLVKVVILYSSLELRVGNLETKPYRKSNKHLKHLNSIDLQTG